MVHEYNLKNEKISGLGVEQSIISAGIRFLKRKQLVPSLEEPSSLTMLATVIQAIVSLNAGRGL